ncbi:MAG: response regulator [Desulfobacteraceae bacterium]|nr:response regulator [Desulfobacteraceae bacterium]
MDILLVEDEVSIAETITENIVNWKYGVETARTGKDALQRFRQKIFDIILLDIFLPDCKGHQLIPEFQKISPETWIVTMTGYNSKELELEVRTRGIAFYLIKPFKMYEMKEILDHMFNKKYKEMKNWRKESIH